MPRTGKGKAPKTPEEYRAHAMAWIVAARGMDDLERWDDEEALREKCGVGDDDLKFLQPHFDAKHKQLSVVAGGGHYGVVTRNSTCRRVRQRGHCASQRNANLEQDGTDG